MQAPRLPSLGDLPELTLPRWPGVRMHVTDRAGGVSIAPYQSLNLGDHVGDASDAVTANRRLAAQALPGPPAWLRQVHSTDVHDADAVAPAHGHGLPVPQADAAVSIIPGRVLAVLSADCLPVVLVDSHARVLAVAHAGWRGLASGVLEAAVAAMRARLSQGGQIRAWLGPAIGPTAFEVGEDVLQAFGADVPPGAFVPREDVAGKWWCNLPLLAAYRLRAAGVGQVVASGVCTYTDRRFYSHRRDGRTGRFATFAWLTAEPGAARLRHAEPIQVDG